jgi:hypothetical protein
VVGGGLHHPCLVLGTLRYHSWVPGAAAPCSSRARKRDHFHHDGSGLSAWDGRKGIILRAAADIHGRPVEAAADWGAE